MCEQCSTAVSKASVPSHAGIHVDEALVKKILAAYQKYVASIASQVGDLDEAAALDAIDEAIDWKGPRNELQRAFEDALGSVSLKGMDRGLKPLKSLEDYEKFKEQFIVENPYLKTWVEEHGAALVTEIDESTRAGLRETIGLAADESWTWSKLKREVKTKVGLLEKDSIAVQSLYDNLIEEGMDENAASDKASAYSAKLHARRAENIARTEIIFAENYGQQAAFLTAKDVGLVTSATKRVWIESPNDGRRCPICAGLGNTESEIDGMWTTIEGDEVGCVDRRLVGRVGGQDGHRRRGRGVRTRRGIDRAQPVGIVDYRVGANSNRIPRERILVGGVPVIAGEREFCVGDIREHP